MQASIFRERRFWLSSLFALLILALAFPSVAQEGENYCRTEISQMMEVGDTLTGSISANVTVGFYCFEGERGDTVTVTVEATDERLIPVIIITDPVFDPNDFEPLAQNVANRPGGTVEVSFEIDSSDTYLIVVLGDVNTLGTFEISLEAEGRSILGGGDDDPTEEPEATETEEPEGGNGGNGGSGTSPDDIVLGETNLCRVDGIEYLEYGDSVSGELDNALPVTWFCFEGTAGDVVTIETGTESGDAVMVLLIAEPFFDGTDSTVYDVAQASNRNDSAELEFLVPEDGDYLIWIQVSEEGQEGEFYLDISGEAGTIYDCTNEPLSTLTSQQWAIASENPESALVTINITCDGQVVLTTMGASEVGFFDINQEGELLFAFGDELFRTISLDETGWTIANSEDAEYQFVPVADTNCSEETMAALINGRWTLATTEGDISLSFTCNGIFVMSSAEQPSFASDYTYEEDTLSINLNGTPLVFEEVVIEDNELSATVEGDEYNFENTLAD